MLAAQRDIPFTERDRSAALMGSIHERLQELDIPVTLVWGMRDPVFQPVFMEQWRELFPRRARGRAHRRRALRPGGQAGRGDRRAVVAEAPAGGGCAPMG